jgi:hypothetical protein
MKKLILSVILCLAVYADQSKSKVTYDKHDDTWDYDRQEPKCATTT